MPADLVPGAPRSSRNHGLDTLRSAAIVLVFMYHYMVFVSGDPTFGWGSTVGWVGVDLFFVLSGYLISNQLFAGLARGERLSLRHFYARRLLRTLPNFYVVLALYFLFPAVMGGKEPPPLWRFLSFTQNISLHSGTAFSHAWSLCIEEQFYLLLPAALLLATRIRRPIVLAWGFLVALIVAGIVLRSALWVEYGREAGGAVKGYYSHVYYASLCRFDEFLPGIAVAMLKNFHRDAWQRLIRWGHAISFAGALAVAVLFYIAFHYYYIDDYGYGFFMTGFGYSLIAIAFAVLVVAALSPRSYLHRVRIPGAAQLAAWSYAIYLSHKPIAVIANRMLGSTGAGTVITVVTITVFCVAGGWLLYQLVETPFMKIRDRYFPTSFARNDPLPARAWAAES